MRESGKYRAHTNLEILKKKNPPGSRGGTRRTGQVSEGTHREKRLEVTSEIAKNLDSHAQSSPTCMRESSKSKAHTNSETSRKKTRPGRAAEPGALDKCRGVLMRENDYR
jgi:hypothetical protein